MDVSGMEEGKAEKLSVAKAAFQYPEPPQHNFFPACL